MHKSIILHPRNRPNCTTTAGFRRKISMKLVYQYMTIFLNFSPTSTQLHPLQVENYDSNSRLVVDKGDNGKFRLERVKCRHAIYSLFYPLKAEFAATSSNT